MSLTRIQQDAIAKARRGDYSLLDAMELEARLERDSVACGYLVGGRLRFLGVADHEETLVCFTCAGEGKNDCGVCEDGQIDCEACHADDDHWVEHEDCKGKGCADCSDGWIECPECEGSGTITCETCKGDGALDCTECDGTGDSDGYVIDHVVNLDGRVVWREYTGTDHPYLVGEVSRAWVRKILEAYQTECRDADKAAAEAARGQCGQTTLIPENA